jgi:thioredoxin reductase (NADPH)
VATKQGPHSAPDTRLVRPRLSDGQLATLQRYGTVEPTTVGQVLFAAGDPSYDLIILLEGAVEVSVVRDGKPWRIAAAGPRDFLAELNLLTGQRVYFTGVVTEAGSIVRVPRDRVVSEVIDGHGDLGAFLLQEMFRRRQMFLQSRAGVQIVGSRYSPDTQRLREFATRNRLAHAWIDLDNDPAAGVLLESAAVRPGDTPVVLFEGTGVLLNPSNAQFAQAAGITDEPTSGRTYDLIVIGAGPAGLAAAVYGASEGLTTAAVDAVAAGGQASTTSRIENYLGFPAGVSGAEFGERALLQAVRFGTQMFVPRRAAGLTRPDGHYLVALEDGTQLTGKSVIVATGVSYRRLDVPDSERFEGLGVFYSPLGPVRDVEPHEPVVIVGGGNSAGQAAVALAGAGHQVHIAVRGAALAASMSTYLLDRITRDERISVHVEAVVSKLNGARQLESVVLRSHRSAEPTTVHTHYLLAMIGAEPHTEWVPPEFARDEKGFLLTGDAVPPAFRHSPEWSALGRAPYLYETSLPGAFAVGDVRAGSVKRVAAAAGEGSMAVRLAQQYLGLVPA